jgi:para-nitrobenzyl esterase
MNSMTRSQLICALCVTTLSACLASSEGNKSSDVVQTDTVQAPEDTGADSILLPDEGISPEPDAAIQDSQSPPQEDAVTDLDAITPLEDTAAPPEDTATPIEVGSVSKTTLFEVKVIENVVFGQGLTHSEWNADDGQPMDLLLDVYRPVRDNPPPMPVVVVIHGGGFVGGTHKHAQLSAMAEGFAGRGFVAFSIDYRVAKHAGTLPPNYPELDGQVHGVQESEQWKALYPACRDAKAAIRWIRSKAAKYSLAPNYITAIGGSAGSFIAVALGVTNENDCVTEVSEESDPTLAGTHLKESSSVHTIIDHWGGSGIVTMLDLINPGERFDASDAPLSIVHGTEDPTVPFISAEDLKAQYEKTGAPFAFVPLVGKGHGPWAAKVDGKGLAELAFDFIVKHQSLTLE